MLPIRCAVQVGCLVVTAAATSAYQDSDLLRFFAEEAEVITASRRPQPIRQAPATVRVITADDLRASGARTLWDALRSVPGVDVMSVRTFHGEVSIRGLNKVLNNRTLVLVDGRSVLNGYTDGVNWESIPVLMEEIDRIEVVQGPASALWGPNAVNGVINIITKSPEQLGRGQISGVLGEHRTRLGSLLLAGEERGLGYRVGLGRRSTHRFEVPDSLASRTLVIDGMLRYRLAGDSWVRVAAGRNDLNTNISFGGLGATPEEGNRSFLQTDYHRADSHLRLFCNTGKSLLTDYPIPELTYYTLDANLQRSLELSGRSLLVAGGEFRRTSLDAEVVPTGRVHHDLWALFVEHEWRPARSWALWSSGRLDRHPHTGLVFSPRFSAIYSLGIGHAVRMSAGTSFRNPTLFENHVEVVKSVDVSRTPGPIRVVDLTLTGTSALQPESMAMLELAYSGQVGRLQSSLSAFHYRLREVIGISEPDITGPEPARLAVLTSYRNTGRTTAWGGEAEVVVRLHRSVDGFANYSYQRLGGESDLQTTAHGMPHHKLNGGLRVRRGRLLGSATVHRVDRTLWNSNSLLHLFPSVYREVPGYTLVDVHLGYRLAGPLRNVEVGFDAFNLVDEKHYEALPLASMLEPGQRGEVIRSRRVLYATCWF